MILGKKWPSELEMKFMKDTAKRYKLAIQKFVP